MGTFRCYLAILVAAYHVDPATLPATGLIAVFGFYTISGFLISRVIDQRYGNGVRGFVGFLANRAARLYPAYWFFLALSALVFVTFGAPRRLPDSFADLSANLLMIDLLGRPSIIAPAWTISIEITYYV